MRSFVAVELSDDCRRALGRATEGLRRLAPGVRWVAPESLHLTLKFIGWLEEADLPRTVECLERAARGIKPFAMEVSGISGFPPHGVPRVVYVGLQEPSGMLEALQKEVDEALSKELGISREDRPFTGHATLGRSKDRRGCPSVDEIVAAVKEQDFGRVEVGSFVLMRSDLRPEGPIYTPLHRFSLGLEP